MPNAFVKPRACPRFECGTKSTNTCFTDATMWRGAAVLALSWPRTTVPFYRPCICVRSTLRDIWTNQILIQMKTTLASPLPPLKTEPNGTTSARIHPSRRYSGLLHFLMDSYWEYIFVEQERIETVNRICQPVFSPVIRSWRKVVSSSSMAPRASQFLNSKNHN